MMGTTNGFRYPKAQAFGGVVAVCGLNLVQTAADFLAALAKWVAATGDADAIANAIPKPTRVLEVGDCFCLLCSHNCRHGGVAAAAEEVANANAKPRRHALGGVDDRAALRKVRAQAHRTTAFLVALGS